MHAVIAAFPTAAVAKHRAAVASDVNPMGDYALDGKRASGCGTLVKGVVCRSGRW